MRNANSKLLGAARVDLAGDPAPQASASTSTTPGTAPVRRVARTAASAGAGRRLDGGRTAIGPGVITTSPESGTILDARSKIIQATYTAPLSNSILVEGGFSSFWTEWGDIRPVARRSSDCRSPSSRRRPACRSSNLGLSRLAGTGRHDPAERPLPRVAVVRDRLAQHEGRLPGRLHDREDAAVRRPADQPTASTTASRTS